MSEECLFVEYLSDKFEVVFVDFPLFAGQMDEISDDLVAVLNFVLFDVGRDGEGDYMLNIDTAPIRGPPMDPILYGDFRLRLRSQRKRVFMVAPPVEGCRAAAG